MTYPMMMLARQVAIDNRYWHNDQESGTDEPRYWKDNPGVFIEDETDGGIPDHSKTDSTGWRFWR